MRILSSIEEVNILHEELNERLAANPFDQDVIAKTEQCIRITLEVIARLKKFIIEYNFKEKQEEICFFKKVKPQFLSKLIYYKGILNLETMRPIGSELTQREHLNKELDKLSCFCEKNANFYKYYRLGATYLDDKYFLRETNDIHFALDNFISDSDPRFSTSHDIMVAKILANETLREYLNNALNDMDGDKFQKQTNDPSAKLTWTLSKTALIELLYALQTVGTFNNSSADVKQIAAYFEIMFNIDLKNFYRTFLEIRMRKTARTSFLDQLKEKLIQRMDEADDSMR